jgi:hypothetical protein
MARFDPQRHSNDLSGCLARSDNASVDSRMSKLTSEKEWRRMGSYAIVGHEKAKVRVIKERARGDISGGVDFHAREDSSIQ